MIYYLKEDVYSFISKSLYAVKGEVVTIVSDHDNVYVVENDKKQRFTCRKEVLSESFIEKETKLIEQLNIKKNGKNKAR